MMLRTILAAAGNRYKAFDPTTWPNQAKYAVEGKWEDLKTYQDSLHGWKRIILTKIYNKKALIGHIEAFLFMSNC